MIEVYTDGACDAGGYGGWAWVSAGDNRGSGAEWPTTNNRMELMAAIDVLRHPVQGGAPIAPVRVVTDSAYVSNCFLQRWYDGWRRNGWVSSKKKPVENRDLWEQLLELVEERQKAGAPVEWVHVRGHGKRASDHPRLVAGNAEADRLAVEARIRLKEQADGRS